MARRYAIGLDYGTLSVRALLLDIDSGEEAGTAVYEYPHGVLSGKLPDGSPIPPDYALAVPEDYLSGLGQVVRDLLRQTGVPPEAVKGIGLDATSATVVPVDKSGTAISMLPGFESSPHAYIKLWKHHGAKSYADKMYTLADNRKEDWLTLVGGKVRCEAFLPKTLETQGSDEAVYKCCHTFLEAGDWLTWYMTGECVRSESMAGCNSFYQPGIGYPDEEFLRKIMKESEPVTRKYKGRFVPLGGCVGRLTQRAADSMGLLPGVPVAAAMIDCHAAVAGAGADRVGDVTAVMGTSACYLLNSHTGEGIPGIYSCTFEAHIPEMFGYEGGQSCVGECLEWFVENCVPESYVKEAKQAGIGIHELLQRKAAAIQPEQCRLVVLDWWNGVRSPLMRPELTGVITGMTIYTKTEEMYLALMEGICFGAKVILDTFRDAGHSVERLIAAGGIPMKSPMMMQMLSDICGMEVRVCESRQSSARGSAIMGAAVADECEKSTRKLKDWIHKLGAGTSAVYNPDYGKRAVYEKKYRKYIRLKEIFENIVSNY